MVKYKPIDEEEEKLSVEELVDDTAIRKKLYTEGNRKVMRNLPQYKNMTDAEYEAALSANELGFKTNMAFEKRIREKMEKFEADYDLSEMRINDLLSLRALCQAVISLEDLEQTFYRLRIQDMTAETMYSIEKISRVMEGLRNDISKISEDLKITRRHRKGDKETSMIAYMEDVKAKAKKFIESRSQLLFCPECHTLLCQVWYLYPNIKSNRIHLKCQRELQDGSKCPGEVYVNSQEILEMGGRNYQEIPESIK